MEIQRSNFKFHKGNIITFTRDNSWIRNKLPNIIKGGWGNGYIGIPIGHPFLNLIKENIVFNPLIQQEMDTTYDVLNDKFPLEGNFFTYSNREEINGIEYYVFGFDTLHYGDNMSNWPESKVVSVIEKYVEIVQKNSQIN